MSLCDRREAHNDTPAAVAEPVWTPEQRIAAQDAVLARWLKLSSTHRNRLLDAARARLGVAIPDQPTFAYRSAQRVTQDGVTHTIREWAILLGWEENAIRYRVSRRQRLLPKPSSERQVA